jgi:hypothetical protein
MCVNCVINCVQQNYIYKFPVSLQYDLQRESHKSYSPPTSVTWLQLLRKQTNTGISTALAAETHTDLRPYDFAHLPTSAMSLGSLILLATEAGDVVQLILLQLRSSLP